MNGSDISWTQRRVFEEGEPAVEELADEPSEESEADADTDTAEEETA